MPEIDKQILGNVAATLPKLTDLEKEKLLAFSEGMAFMKKQEQERQNEERPA